MADNIDTSTGQAAVAFRGPRNDIWHRMGQQHQDGWTVDDWAKNAGLNWNAFICPAMVDMTVVGLGNYAPDPRTGLPGIKGDHLVKVESDRYIVRSDNGHVLGHTSNRYQPVQPRELLDWFERYCAVDPRFQLDVAGALKQGEIIWATATFRPNGDEITVAGEAHKARLLMTTTFDGTGSTINRATMTRVVCNNTLDTALADKAKSVVRTRHSTRFDPARVGAELAAIAKGFAAYKAMGEAMAAHTMTKDQVTRLFKHVLEIPFDAPSSEVSARKRNQFGELSNAFTVSRCERGEPNHTANAWTALNAVTRYVDHDRDVRGNVTQGNGNKAERRFTSSVVDPAGSGQGLKARAVAYLEEIGCDWRGDADMRAVLAQPLRSNGPRA
jgi:phage/plasmid-like protein (TIGR03299 family)